MREGEEGGVAWFLFLSFIKKKKKNLQTHSQVVSRATHVLPLKWPGMRPRRVGHVTPLSGVSSPGNRPRDGQHRLPRHERDLPSGGAQGAPAVL